MRVPILAGLLATTPLRAQVSAGDGTELSAAERAALEQLGEAHATTFELVDSWFTGRPVRYHDVGRDAARPAILYRVRGGSDVVTTLPGLEGYSGALRAVYVVELGPTVDASAAVPGVPGYSDMWQIQFVQVGGRFEPGSYRDYRRALADARAGRFRLIDPEVVVNCPVMYVDGRPAAR